ncbi:hypothetical protein ACI2KE_04145 [Pseudomonas monteilii]|jgi:hypothetical protein|uniref:hypothetical protein n=1 Tax=Pseudomonas alabamensis TaxID=3064349 RepID=UPI0011A38ECD|nr:hypothetical protein [Pseudomonas sp. 22-AL-CL-001]MDO7910327.1 hypothetical protein [Pseudomonas sp. 22-AL-CL-001]
MKRFILPLLACLVSAGTAQASSEQAWTEHRQQVLKTCLAASQFKDAHVRGKPVEFEDQVGYSALVLEGTYPQKHLNKRTGTELCLFDKQQQRAFVSEWQASSLKGRLIR